MEFLAVAGSEQDGRGTNRRARRTVQYSTVHTVEKQRNRACTTTRLELSRCFAGAKSDKDQ